VIPATELPIVGAGPTGALLAILLTLRGHRVSLFDSRPDPRGSEAVSGRSINLALADRGIVALRRAGVYEAIEESLVPMRGRLIHAPGGATELQPYGRRPAERIYSISRDRLSRALLEVAVERQGVGAHFEHRLESADFAAGSATLRELSTGRLRALPMHPLIAADGAGSRMRQSLAAAGLITATGQEIEVGYKELSIPAGAGGAHRMQPDALHIWPRGGFMLIALPNRDGSFTATLFLPWQGEPGFASLTAAVAIEEFLQRNFPDACALMPDRIAQFQAHPTGSLGTVFADPWHHAGMVALIGDAAHAIVPFHGQGMNCCFEDCLVFDACVAGHARWQDAFEDFAHSRKPDTDAIAAMALENYEEMRDRVANPAFQLQQRLSHELEGRHPGRFIPRYSMVMFHHEIPYRVARERGVIQARLLRELTAGVTEIQAVDFERARREIEAQLPLL
jgi:kynurenine 3-monooxygenase